MAGRSDIEAGGAFVRLFLKNDLTRQLVRTLRNAGQSMQSFGGTVQKIGAPIAAAGAAITAGFGAAVNHFAAVGDHLDKMAQRTGIAAPALAELGFAAEQSGASLENVENALLKMNRRIGRISVGQGSGQQVKAMAALGLSAEKLRQMAPEEQLLALSDAMEKHGNQAAAAGLAQRAFGTAVDKILPLLMQGKTGMEALRKEARELGIVPTEQEVANAAKVTDAINRVRRVVKGMLFDVGASLADSIMSGLEAVKNIAVATGKWIKENAGLIRTVAAIGAGLLVAGTAITMFGTAIIGVGMAISALGTIISTVAGIVGFLLSPIGLITAGLAVGVYAWARYTESGKAAVESLSAFLGDLLAIGKQTFGGIVDAIKAGDLKLAGEIAFAGLRLAVAEGLLALRSLVGDTVTSIVGKLASGDFSGAWSDTLEQLSLLWAAWSEGVVNVITGVARKITEVWQRATTFIAQKILELGKMPAFAEGFERITGVNLIEEQKRGEDTQRKERESVARGIEEFTGQHAGLQEKREAALSVKDPLEQQRDALDAEIRALAGGNEELINQLTRRQELEKQFLSPGDRDAMGPEAGRRLIEEIEAIDDAIESVGADADLGALREKITARLQVEGDLIDAEEVVSQVNAEIQGVEGHLQALTARAIELGVPYDIVAEAQDAAAGDIARQAEAITAELDKINRRAAMNTEAAAASAVATTEDGMAAIREEARTAREDLDLLTREAEEKRVTADAAKAKADETGAPTGPAAIADSRPGTAASVRALTTSSAASAEAAGYGGGGPKDVAAEMHAMHRTLKEQERERAKQLAAMERVAEKIEVLAFGMRHR